MFVVISPQVVLTPEESNVLLEYVKLSNRPAHCPPDGVRCELAAVLQTSDSYGVTEVKIISTAEVRGEFCDENKNLPLR